MKTFKKILIANRGEIAVRIIKAAHEMGIQTVAVYSQADKEGLHVHYATESRCIGHESLADTYLNVDKIMEAAKATGADAIHPGYGFLAENPNLVAACEANQIAFIGPSTQAIKLMGNKIEARNFVEKLGIPMTKGVTGSPLELIELARQIELPILVKAAAGGGGKGMRIVRNWDELQQTIESTSREALAYFGDAEVYVEKYVENPRHIEIQILGDKHGNIIHLYERECSIQRRYQKIIEESPSPTLTPEIREKMGQAAVDIAKAIGYYSAGTIEFLVDAQLNFYFLEMNTRIQVEHPVTEMVTGVDIVAEQIRAAAGNALSYAQSQIIQKGHAIEARIYAEDPANDFRPAPGHIHYYKSPMGNHIRIDSGIAGATEIKSFFDPMISKLIVWGENRAQATTGIISALEDYVILGIQTNISFMLQLLRQKAFINNEISTKYCDVHAKTIVQESELEKSKIPLEAIAAAHISKLLYPFTKSQGVWGEIGFWRMLMEFKLLINDATKVFQVKDKQTSEFTLLSEGNAHFCQVLDADENYTRLVINEKEFELYSSENSQGSFDFWVQGHQLTISDLNHLPTHDFYESSHESAGGSHIKSPMPGKVIKLLAQKGQTVKKGETLVIVEAMKMENNILAPRDGIIDEIFVKAGDMVDGSKVLLNLEESDS